jgi:hypothetical protein
VAIGRWRYMLAISKRRGLDGSGVVVVHGHFVVSLQRSSDVRAADGNGLKGPHESGDSVISWWLAVSRWVRK